MTVRYYLIFDLGTTNLKAMAYDERGRPIRGYYKRAKVECPYPGWVQQDPEEYREAILNLGKEVIDELGTPSGIGITNQRATTIVWDRETGDPVYDMITWQDTRSYEIAEELSKIFVLKLGRALGKISEALAKVFRSLEKSEKVKYLITIAYVSFSANQPVMHLKWLMDNVEGIRRMSKEGKLAFGTLDSWAIYSLVGKHLSDITNASATGMFDPFFLKWSDRILDLVGINKRCLPNVVENCYKFGSSEELEGAELKAVIADQQASLLYAGTSSGTMKITNGTGSFVDLNVGSSPMPGRYWTYPMIAYKVKGEASFLLEGIVQCSGSAIDWMVEMGLARDPAEVCEMASRGDSRGVVFFPTFSGVGTPYWRDLRGGILGLTRGISRENLARALMEGIASRCSEVIWFVERAYGNSVKNILADGKVSRCDSLLQLIADITGKEIVRPKDLEGTIRGALLLVKGYGKRISELWEMPEIEKAFLPKEKKDLENFRRKLRRYIKYHEELVFTSSSEPL